VDAFVRALNALIEDTCVLIAVAYLLARGPLLALLYRERLTLWQATYLGSIFGLIGLTEAAFPGARFPYATHTLIVTFATLTGSLRVGLTAAGVAAVGSFLLSTPLRAAVTALDVFTGALLAETIRRGIGTRHRLVGGGVAGLVTQACAFLIWLGLLARWGSADSLWPALLSVPANGFGVMLLLLVVHDAQLRARSEQHRADAERAQALVAEAQLNALRARVRPHFLFNTLTSIAGLCGVSPDQAEAAIVRLGQLMRRVLEADANAPVCLQDEIQFVQAYLEIEQLRLGGRLRVNWRIDPACGRVLLPPFAVQTLVENAIQHGIAPKVKPGAVTITARRYPRHTLVAVVDDGVGMSTESRCRATDQTTGPAHGLRILNQQLVLLYDRRARLHLFSHEEASTVAAFVVPTGDPMPLTGGMGANDSSDSGRRAPRPRTLAATARGARSRDPRRVRECGPGAAAG
jgi:LytS/YehU family sensor histidine kinase